MRRWHHEVSAEWLRARQAVLTATDVAGLLPEFKRYLKAGSPDVPTPGFSALWCQKHSDVHLDTSSPSPAAARGHIMEPYAIEEWNRQAVPTFYHWDDAVICNKMFGFSPDAMVIPQLTNDARLEVTTDGKFMVAASQMHYDCPDEVMEVKCYDPAQHMKSVVCERMEHKELMQLAMAFVVLPKLDVARILWYCPGAPVSMFTERYTRDDLHDQIRWVLEVAEIYQRTENYWNDLMSKDYSSLKAEISEDRIYEEFVAENDGDNIFILK